jgi:cyclic pyranopterin phosphate synthase
MSVAGTLLDLDRPAGHPAPLIDPFARAITYAGVGDGPAAISAASIACPRTCQFLPKADLLSLEELDRLCSAFVARACASS